ncbi:Stage II sporulation protein E (SpoIIE) [Streptomyces sp. YIM 130001]|uniref:PP2C family protein-serine/threonine phosphatase n=1 Tax=Streptomyces sp. YIM 130001 TaxID=2259644 RepID=UPI000EC8063A|nr:PP2C family protein-serine/threonine phosphatase [Streptomyces sp. YIM 130001]RII12035.1 Stage II sporulation protein E (SpoIIE) [Streptomyces sp. YIM 130001]
MGKQEERGEEGAHEGTRTRRLVRVLPVFLMLFGIAFDWLTPPEFTGSPFFAGAPLTAAPLYSLRGTVATGLAALAGMTGLRVWNHVLARAESLTEIATVLTVAVLAVLINRVVRRSGKQLESAQNVAEAAQRAVLPEPAERIGGLDVAARYEAAQAGAFIGGDMYAVQDTPYGVRLLVGDVRGKGLGAVEAVAVVIGAFREAAEQEATLEAVAQRLERALAREGTRRNGLDAFEGFTTAVLGEIPRDRSVVRLVNRGHPPPLMLSANGGLRVLTPREFALPLGMGDLGNWPDRAEEAEFPCGSLLLLYTDGLSEARDEAGVFYDPAERLSGRMFPGPDELLALVVDEVMVHTGGGSTDDMALLSVGRPSASP